MHSSRARVTATATASSPDPSWRPLYRAGGVTAFVYVVLGLLVPEILFVTSPYAPTMSGAVTLQYVAAHRAQWVLVQVLSLGLRIVVMVTFLAVGVALRHVNKSYAAIGTLISLTSQVLILAYWPVAMGQLFLSQQFVATTADAQRLALATAAETLNAQNSIAAHGIETRCALGITILSGVMLRGVFPKCVAYLGMATFPVAVLGEVLAATFDLGELVYVWWVLFSIWLIVVGWTLSRFGTRGN